MKTSLKLTALAAALFPILASAGGLPGGGTWRIGNGTLTAPNGQTLNIDVTGSNGQGIGLIDFSGGFNIDQGNTVNVQNDTGRALGLIAYDSNPGHSPSAINGALNAPASGGHNTTVLVINPNGVNVGGTAAINTSGGFVAGAGLIDDNGVTHGAPAGSVAIKLTQAFITVSPQASIHTGDAQGAGEGIAFLGVARHGGQYGGTPDADHAAEPYFQGDGVGGGSLPFVSGQYVAELYPYIDPATGLTPDNDLFGSTFFLHGFNLDNSGAVYKFNGPYQFALLIAGQWDNNDVGTDFYEGGHPFNDVLFGHVDLGNATFAAHDGGGLFVGTSSISGGTFSVADDNPGGDQSAIVHNTLFFDAAGDVDGTHFVANGSGRAMASDPTSASLIFEGNASNIDVSFGANAWMPSLFVRGALTDSIIASAAGNAIGPNHLNLNVQSISGGSIHNTGDASASVTVSDTYAGTATTSDSADLSVSAGMLQGGSIDGKAVSITTAQGASGTGIAGDTVSLQTGGDLKDVTAEGATSLSVASQGSLYIDGGRYSGGQVDFLALIDIALAGASQVDGNGVAFNAVQGNLDFGADGSAVLVQGSHISGNAGGDFYEGSAAALKVKDPDDANGNNTIYIQGPGNIGGSADVQSSGHTWVGSGVAVDPNATVRGPTEPVDAAPANPAGIDLRAGGTTQINGTLYAGAGPVPAQPTVVPVIPQHDVVLDPTQDDPRWRKSTLRLPTNKKAKE